MPQSLRGKNWRYKILNDIAKKLMNRIEKWVTGYFSLASENTTLTKFGYGAKRLENAVHKRCWTTYFVKFWYIYSTFYPIGNIVELLKWPWVLAFC